MKAAETSFYEWQKKFSTDQRCMAHLAKLRWLNGFQCPHCGHDHGYYTEVLGRYECADCHRQTSATSGTLFHATKLPLTKWFWAIYWMGMDKRGISALRLSKLIGVTWRSAYRILEKLRKAMGHRDSIYRLSDIVELDDALVGGKKPGKRGRGAEGKVSVLIACENRGDKPGFIAMEAVESVNKATVQNFAKHRIRLAQTVRTDGLPANNGLQLHVTHVAKVTPPEMANEWLPWVHVAIANMKRFLLGTFHGTSNRYLQDYLNEFCYRFNRRFWEAEIPNRLLRLCVDHRPFACRETVS
ncbi:MAG: IS1595 family transposase [Gammaproteobacteria bacterium]|nr:IS1595 family transposase [Gammaproteobacteria bacterium]